MKVKSLVVLMSVALIGLGFKVNGQEVMRGMDQSVDLKVAESSILLELIVEEIEDSGFIIDIEEGFEEEWEEEIWISSQEEFSFPSMDPFDPLFSVTEIISVEEFEDEWDEVIWEEGAEDEFALETDWAMDNFINSSNGDDSIEGIMFGELGDEFFDGNLEEAYDPGWDEIKEEIEFDELEFEMEDEDIDLMEEIHNAI